MHQRALGPFQVSAIGLGCMNLSHAYGQPPTPERSRELLAQALDLGCTLFDTAALYGFGANESLVGPVLKAQRDRITLCSKGGMAGEPFPEGMKRVIDGRPETLRRHCEASLKRLGTEVIDLYYLHRWDRRVPIEESVGALSRLVDAGKVRALGLSEVSAATLRRAHAVHPIAALQSEYSLWTRNPEIAVLDTCRELGVAFVAFSPVARGFLGTLEDVTGLAAQDIRRSMPRFAPEVYAANRALLAPVQALAQALGCSVAQLGLAWLLHRGPHIVPIPGTTDPRHLAQNLAADRIALTPEQMRLLEHALAPHRLHGSRYNAATQAEIDTEEF
jgi:aryl-alcohol dehydrogenase-like predicted oxidoreductase